MEISSLRLWNDETLAFLLSDPVGLYNWDGYHTNTELQKHCTVAFRAIQRGCVVKHWEKRWAKSWRNKCLPCPWLDVLSLFSQEIERDMPCISNTSSCPGAVLMWCVTLERVHIQSNNSQFKGQIFQCLCLSEPLRAENLFTDLKAEQY